jgi:hypothetical protein
MRAKRKIVGSRRRGLSWFIFCVAALATVAARAEETVAERRDRVERMDPQEREQLAQNYERFQRLDPAEQQRLRALKEEIEADPKRDELLKTMQGYQEWLSELPASQRIMLSALPPEERLKRIDELRGAQSQGRRNRLEPADVKVLNAWLTKYDLQKRWGEALREGRPTTVTAEELAELRGGLSESAQQLLDQAKTEDEQRRLFRSWVFQSRMPGWGGDRRSGSRRPSPEELHAMFKNELTDSERSYLRALPPEQMQRELAHLWRERRAKAGDASRDRPGNRPHGGNRRGGGKPDSAAPET